MSNAGALVFMVGLILSVLAFFFALEWRLDGLKSAVKMIGFVVSFMVALLGIAAFWLWLGSVIA